jgi:hypothetical protein
MNLTRAIACFLLSTVLLIAAPTLATVKDTSKPNVPIDRQDSFRRIPARIVENEDPFLVGSSIDAETALYLLREEEKRERGQGVLIRDSTAQLLIMVSPSTFSRRIGFIPGE